MADDKSFQLGRSGLRTGQRRSSTMTNFLDFLTGNYSWEPFQVPFLVFSRGIGFASKRGRPMMRLAVDAGSSYSDKRDGGSANRIYRLRKQSESPLAFGRSNNMYQTLGVESTPNPDLTISQFSIDDLPYGKRTRELAGKAVGYLDPRNLPYADRAGNLAKRSINYLDPRGWGNPLWLLSKAFGCISVRHIQIGGRFVLKTADLVQIRTLSNLMNFLIKLVRHDLPTSKLMTILKKVLTKYDPRRPEDVINVIAAVYVFIRYFLYEASSESSLSEILIYALDEAAPEFLELLQELKRLNGSAMECVKYYLINRQNADPKKVQAAVDEADCVLKEAYKLAQAETD